MQFWMISTSDAPLWACAALRTMGMCFRLVSNVRATNRAPAPSARLSALSGESTEPCGVDGDRVPSWLVGEYWPLVRP